MQDNVPVFISIINFLYGGQGHVLEYHLAVRRSVNLNKWKHIAAYSSIEALDEIPQEWSNCLKGDFLEKVNVYRIFQNSNLLKSIKSMHSYGNSIYKFLKKNHNSSSIVFMETFNSLQLLSLLFALLFSKRDGLHLWLMYRNKPQVYGRIESSIFNICNVIFGIFLKDKFHIITDSDLLKASLSTFFKHSVSVMPIPHTSEPLLQTTRKNDKEAVCWWGGPPRHNKGWDVIKRIAGSDESVASNLTLIAATGANLKSLPGRVNVLTVKDFLDRDVYVKQLLACDICLLPYDPNVYGESTSGIFVECVVAGKIPIASKATWMAFELKKFKLEGLITDWQDPKIVEWLLSVAQQEEIRSKLIIMQNAYRNYHNESNYALSIKYLFNRSLINA